MLMNFRLCAFYWTKSDNCVGNRVWISLYVSWYLFPFAFFWVDVEDRHFARACAQDITSNVLHTYVAVSTVVHSVVFRADLFMLVLKYDQSKFSTGEVIQPTVKY